MIVNGSGEQSDSAGRGTPAAAEWRYIGQGRVRNVKDWGSGFTGNLTITNTGMTAISGWTLAFDFVGTISSIWDATIVSHVGNHYVIKDAGYNASIAAGQRRDDRFNAFARTADFGANELRAERCCLT